MSFNAERSDHNIRRYTNQVVDNVEINAGEIKLTNILPE